METNLTVSRKETSVATVVEPDGAETSLEVVRSQALNPITGSLPEKMLAFKQMMSDLSMSGIAPPGWESAQKIAMACWMGDALGMHPVLVMQNHHVATFNGKLMIEPKWEFMLGLVRARLPGFWYETVEESDEKFEAIFHRGKESHRVTYTQEDAQRQGFAVKDTYKTHSREMFLKQGMKRGLKRIASDVLMGFSAEIEVENDAAAPLAAAAQLEAAGAPAVEAQAILDYREALSKLIDRVWGAGKVVKKETKLQVCNVTLKQMAKEQGEPAPPPLKNAAELSPFAAKSIHDYLAAKYPEGATAKVDDLAGNGAQEAPAATGRGEAPPASPPVEEAPPALEAAAAPPPPVKATESDEARERDEADGRIDTLMAVVREAQKKLPGRTFVKEAPAGSKKFWLVDADTVSAINAQRATAGFPPLADSDRKLQVDGAQAVSAEVCKLYVREIRRAAEGGKR